MSKLNMSVSTSCLRFIVLLCLLTIYVSAKNLDDIAKYEDDYHHEESKRFLTPDSLFLLKNGDTHSVASSIPLDYDLSYGPVRLIPFKKRTIPIELQKALYAHGIVGRRR